MDGPVFLVFTTETRRFRVKNANFAKVSLLLDGKAKQQSPEAMSNFQFIIMLKMSSCKLSKTELFF